MLIMVFTSKLAWSPFIVEIPYMLLHLLHFLSEFCEFNRIRKIWYSISGQYFYWHRVTHRVTTESDTGWAEFGRDGSISFPEDLLLGQDSLTFHGIMLIVISYMWGSCSSMFAITVWSISCHGNKIFTTFINSFLSFELVNRFFNMMSHGRPWRKRTTSHPSLL